MLCAIENPLSVAVKPPFTLKITPFSDRTGELVTAIVEANEYSENKEITSRGTRNFRSGLVFFSVWCKVFVGFAELICFTFARSVFLGFSNLRKFFMF